MADMNLWIIMTIVLVLEMVPCGLVIVRRSTVERLVGLQVASTLATLVMMLLSQVAGQSTLYDLILTFALLSIPAQLIFAHFLERWL